MNLHRLLNDLAISVAGAATALALGPTTAR
jgi:hypothetical protein